MHKIIKIFIKLFGPKTCYRFGRGLYMYARGDCANSMYTNGEFMLQKQIIKSVSKNQKLICFDVGGFVGDWSAAFLKNCHDGGLTEFQLYVFEPVPSTMEIMKKRLGNHDNVKFESYALSSNTGEDTIYVSNKLSGANSLHQENNQSVAVPINKITSMDFVSRNQLNNIDLLKIDTEGHDFDIIVGTIPLLKEKRIAVLQFEYNHRWIFSRHYLKDVFDLIEGLPYRLGKLCENYILLYDSWNHEHDRFFESNYVLIRSDALSWFRVEECKLDQSNTLAVPR